MTEQPHDPMQHQAVALVRALAAEDTLAAHHILLTTVNAHLLALRLATLCAGVIGQGADDAQAVALARLDEALSSLA